jgi:hypothetical protein
MKRKATTSIRKYTNFIFALPHARINNRQLRVFVAQKFHDINCEFVLLLIELHDRLDITLFPDYDEESEDLN